MLRYQYINIMINYFHTIILHDHNIFNIHYLIILNILNLLIIHKHYFFILIFPMTYLDLLLNKYIQMVIANYRMFIKIHNVYKSTIIMHLLNIHFIFIHQQIINIIIMVCQILLILVVLNQLLNNHLIFTKNIINVLIKIQFIGHNNIFILHCHHLHNTILIILQSLGSQFRQ